MKGTGRRVTSWWVGAAALGLLLAAALPADAATSVRTADGGLLTVEEVGGTPSAGVQARGSQALAFTWESVSGTRSGLVTPTLDAAVDESPLLTVDQRSGRPILIWSRHDGTALKLAWARFDGDGWSEPHFLTFGPGDDRAPAVGTSTAGSYLFWRGDRNQVFQAPVDLGSGRLFAAPRELPIAASGSEDRGHESRGAREPLRMLSPQGGSDVPVVIGRQGGSDVPVVIGRQGGSDVPVVIGTPNGTADTPVSIVASEGSGSFSSPLLAVFSNPSCATQILLLGSPRGRSLMAVELAGSGRVGSLGRQTIPPGVAPEDAVTAAGSRFLDAACR